MQNPNKQNPQHTDLLGDLKELGRKVAGQFLESLENEYAPQRLSLADFLATHSTTLDNTILKTEKTENLNYQAGNAFLRVVGNRQMQLQADLYYKDTQGSWVRKQTQSPVMDMEIYLNDEAVGELEAQTEMKFAVEKPVAQK